MQWHHSRDEVLCPPVRTCRSHNEGGTDKLPGTSHAATSQFVEPLDGLTE